jgi:hypothetical protein
MAINIKNRETEALLGEIRTMTGMGTTELVLDMARERAERLRRERDLDRRREAIDRACREAAAKIPPDAPSADEIIGYDEWGLPT